MDPTSSFSFQQVIENLARSAGDIGTLLAAIANVLGIFFVVAALLLAKASANPSARADHGKSAWLWSLVFGALMLSLPTTIASVAATMFGPSTTTDLTFAYTQQPDHKLAALIPVLKIFGVIAVIRGLIVLRAVGMYGNHSKGNASFAKGLTLVIAGVLLVHMKNVLGGLLTSIIGVNLGTNLF
jgi:hypothetical protein